MAGQGSLFKRFIAIAFSSLFFVFLSPDHKQIVGPSIALANPDAGNDSDDSKKSKTTYKQYQLRQILAWSPTDVRKTFVQRTKGTEIIIIGFSDGMSRMLLEMMSQDVVWTKNLLRKMRDAKTDKERKKILDELEKETSKEIVRLQNEGEEAVRRARRKDKLDVRWTYIRLVFKEADKQDLLDRWRRNLKEGKLPKKIPVVE